MKRYFLLTILFSLAEISAVYGRDECQPRSPERSEGRREKT